MTISRARERVLPLGVQLLRDAGQRRRGATRSTTRTRARTSRSPRCTTTSRGRWRRSSSGRRSASSRAGCRGCTWTRAVLRDRRPRRPVLRGEAGRVPPARRRLLRDRAVQEFVAAQLPHLDELVLDWFASADFDDLLVTVRSTYPAHEHEQFVAHYRGLVGLWRATRRRCRRPRALPPRRSTRRGRRPAARRTARVVGRPRAAWRPEGRPGTDSGSTGRASSCRGARGARLSIRRLRFPNMPSTFHRSPHRCWERVVPSSIRGSAEMFNGDVQL